MTIVIRHICAVYTTIQTLLLVQISTPPSPAKRYNELFPKEKKEKSKKAGAEGKEEGKGKKQQKTAAAAPTPKKKEAEPEEEEPKPAKFVDPYTSLPRRWVAS